jgi:HEAT repeat protein
VAVGLLDSGDPAGPVCLDQPDRAEVHVVRTVVWGETYFAPGTGLDVSLLGERKPNIKSLVRRDDVAGLIEATSYRNVTPNTAGILSDVGIPVRVEAIRALGALASDRGHKAIAAGLRDPADQVRCAAVRVLRELHEVGVLAHALRWLPRDAGHSRTLAVQAIIDLRSVSASAVADALVHREDEDLLGDEDSQLILAVLEDQGADARDEVHEVLVRALGDERGIVVDRSAEMLIQLAPESIEALVEELRTGSHPAEAAYVLGRIGHPETLDVLVKALRHSDAHTRAESAAALAELQDPGAVKPLLRATHDTEPSVRSQARMALDRMGTIAVIVGVAELLRPVVREAVRSAMPNPEAEADADKPRPRSPARRQSRSRRSNGGPPAAADPQPTRRESPP